MRDILVTLIVFGLLPSVLRSPVNGVLMWVWTSVVNRHTQGWGALTTIFSLLFTHEPRALPWTPLHGDPGRLRRLDVRHPAVFRCSSSRRSSCGGRS